MWPVLRRALTATMDITRTRARLTGITGLAGLKVESSSELVRGMAGVGADADSGADVLALADGPGLEVGLDLEDGLGSADAVKSVADFADQFAVVEASMVARFTVVEVDSTAAAVMVAEATGKF
jgi:hypothetical protein